MPDPPAGHDPRACRSLPHTPVIQAPRGPACLAVPDMIQRGMVVESVKDSQDMTGWLMAQDWTFALKAHNDTPIGHMPD